MREQYTEISMRQIREAIPADMKEELDREAGRLLDLMLQHISYSDDIRMTFPGGGRFSLGALDSDEQALAVFRLHLEMEQPAEVLLGVKVKKGKLSDTLFGFLRRNVRLRIPAAQMREIGKKIIRTVDDQDRGNGRGRRRERDYLAGGVAAVPDQLGRAVLLAYLAGKIAGSTKILHACAARYQLLPAEDMLNLYDSIQGIALDHVPDLFPEARKLKRHFVIHVGGTNTGKTYDAMKALAHAGSGVYLCPLRMLAYEGRAVIESYGVPCSFATGEEKEIDPRAAHESETIGMLNFDRHYDMAVIDECQLISGEDGSLYTNAILGVQADVVQVCCAYSGLPITKKLITLCGDDYEVVEHHRSSELKFEEEPYRGPRKNDAYIVFSRLGAYEMAGWLEKKGMHPSIVYGKLPYEVKMEEARKFERGDTDCLVATDAIAIGQNYNIERIIFRDTVKHINRKEVQLDTQTVKQVAGRAGRYGRFPVGYVNTFEARDRDEIRRKLEAADQPSQTAPLELPSFLVDKDLPLSLIYKAWNEAECGDPFIKADTTVELYICRLIEEKYRRISRRDEYSLASLPLDLKDREQEKLLDNLLYAYDKGNTTDEEWKFYLPDKDQIRKLVRYRPHMMTLEKLVRQLDLASSFFYKIRRDDLADYAIRLKPPVTKRIGEIMAESSEEEKKAAEAGGEEKKAAEAACEEKKAAEAGGEEKTRSEEIKKPDKSDWITAYIYVGVSGQCERNTGRYPYGDYSRLPSRYLPQSWGNEASYIDYYCYKRKSRTPDFCSFEPYFRYTVKLDPKYIVSDEGTYFLAEHFDIVKCDYQHSASPYGMDDWRGGSGSYGYYRNDHGRGRGRHRH